MYKSHLQTNISHIIYTDYHSQLLSTILLHSEA